MHKIPSRKAFEIFMHFLFLHKNYHQSLIRTLEFIIGNESIFPAIFISLHPQNKKHNYLNMKRIIAFALICLATIFQAHAVLKEKDLAQTLGVLRAELERTYNEESYRLARFEKKNAEQHTNLIKMMQRSDQISLMLYSQNSDFTFDMAYACQSATEQYRTLKTRHLPYAKMKERLLFEIDRYSALIQALQNIPPHVTLNGEFAQVPDSIRALMPKLVLDTTQMSPFLLDEQGLQDREACLNYAIALREKYQKMLDIVIQDEKHYELVTKRVKELNDYAMSRYEKIQHNIFVNGGENYFSTLKRFRLYYVLAKKDVDDKYKPLNQRSQWRGPVIIGISIFMLFYILLASFLSYAIMRWLLPKRIRQKHHEKQKRPFVTLACGVAIFAISIMIARLFVKQNFILMAIDLMITFSWLLEAILLSLLIRLKDRQIISGVKAYTPFIIMAFFVIIFRIILIPNNLVNLIFPPLLLLFTCWQAFILKRQIGHLPDSDMVYTVISLLTMIGGCVAAWLGFVLLAVEIMVWWTIQLAAIQTITCFYDMAKSYEMRRLVNKIALTSSTTNKHNKQKQDIYKKIKPKMAKGEYISKTWLYDFFYRAVFPILAIVSIPASIYFAANIFEMSSFCIKIFLYPFVNKPGYIQLSLFKICVVLELFFLFRYLNYAIRSFFQMFKKRKSKDPNGPSNITFANNIISFVIWGIYVITSLILLQIPSKGISIVMAGLATGLGFAMKDLLENFVYGISLMTGRLRVGDYIECDGIQGKVESINYQSTQIITIDGSVIAFQNATLFSKNFKNLTRNHGYVMVKIPVGIAYGTNIEHVRNLLLEAINAMPIKNAAGKNIIDTKQKVSVLFNDFGESSVDLFVVCWVLVEEKAAFIAKVKELIYITLNQNNIEIPFPQRDIYIRRVESSENISNQSKPATPKKKSKSNNESAPATNQTPS